MASPTGVRVRRRPRDASAAGSCGTWWRARESRWSGCTAGSACIRPPAPTCSRGAFTSSRSSSRDSARAAHDETVQSFDELSEIVAGAIDALGLTPVRPARDLVRRRHRAASCARSSGRRVRLDPRVSRGVPAPRLDPSGPGDRSARPAPASRAGASRGDRSGGDAEAERARQPLVADDRSRGAGRSPARPARSDAGDVRGRRYLDSTRACAPCIAKTPRSAHPYSFTTPRTRSAWTSPKITQRPFVNS